MMILWWFWCWTILSEAIQATWATFWSKKSVNHVLPLTLCAARSSIQKKSLYSILAHIWHKCAGSNISRVGSVLNTRSYLAQYVNLLWLQPNKIDLRWWGRIVTQTIYNVIVWITLLLFSDYTSCTEYLLFPHTLHQRDILTILNFIEPVWQNANAFWWWWIWEW